MGHVRKVVCAQYVRIEKDWEKAKEEESVFI